jgi:DNA-binding NarL/FixJ family response regulator
MDRDRVLMADDHPLFRDGLRAMLRPRQTELVGEATTGDAAIRKRWTCCLMWW